MAYELFLRPLENALSMATRWIHNDQFPSYLRQAVCFAIDYNRFGTGTPTSGVLGAGLPYVQAPTVNAMPAIIARVSFCFMGNLREELT